MFGLGCAQEIDVMIEEADRGGKGYVTAEEPNEVVKIIKSETRSSGGSRSKLGHGDNRFVTWLP